MSFGEPVVHGSQEISGFSALPLIAPEAGEAGGGAQLPRLRTLPSGDVDHIPQHSLCFRLAAVVTCEQQLSLKSM